MARIQVLLPLRERSALECRQQYCPKLKVKHCWCPIGFAHAFAGHGHNVEASLEGALAFWKLGVQKRELNERCVKFWSPNGCGPTQGWPPRLNIIQALLL